MKIVRISRVITTLLLILITTACVSISEPAGLSATPSVETTVYLVRHAEKQAGANPSLTEAGETRADQLAERLADAELQYIHSTNYKRTLETAAPVAQELGLEVQLYDPRDLPAFARQLKEQGGRHLVVGHSNTTPALVSALGGDPGTPIDEKSEYDRLYIVTFYADSTVSTDLQRYRVRYDAE
ncbi:MAG: histidine phosphatase family protein [Aquisalinus sp.]|nr:histidine phosphatase family protein [Aquisalinus sp.]